MNDSYESSQAQPGEGWLLLIHQIPAKPDYFRIKVRRRLQRIGAIPLKGSVYVLPRTDEALEDFQWLRRSIVDEGGEATVCVASLFEGISDEEIQAMFRARSDDEYAEIVEAAREVSAEPTQAEVERLERRLAQVVARDFYEAEGAFEAERAVGELAARRGGEAPANSGPAAADAPGAATWVTRRGVEVDRIACAWLIRRFIDPAARFRYVPARGYRPEPGEVLYDMFEGGFTHEGDRCTFEVLVARFTPGDPSLVAIGELVHDIDCKDEKFGREEAAGVASVIRGIVASHEDDGERVAAGAGLFDGLHAAFGAAGAGGSRRGGG